MEWHADSLEPRQLYKLITGSVVPRPIAWVSTRSKDGKVNLAPFSYFNAVAAKPPTLMFSSGMKDPATPKDTLKNIEETEHFVINIVTEATAEAMNMSAINAPHGVDEFELAGLTPKASKTVDAPRVSESPINFECKLIDIYRIGQNSVIFGRITYIHVHDEVYSGDYKINAEALRPVGRLAGQTYTRVRDLFDMVRPSYED